MVGRHSDSRWLVHIGAGRSSVNVLLRARAQGYLTLAIDIDPHAPGLTHATRFIVRSHEDVTGIQQDVRDFSKHHRLVGCFTASSSSGAAFTAAQLREDHDLPGLRLSEIRTLLDRSEWKKRLVDRSIPTPESALLSSSDDLEQFLSVHASVLLKPGSGGSGSLGVSRIRIGEPRNLDLYEEARRVSTSQLVLAETFVSGDEYSIDGFVRGGEFGMLHVGRKFSVRNHRGILPTGYAWGASKPDSRSGDDPRWARFEKLAGSVADALGLDDTLLSLDVLDDGDTTTIIDVGAQLDAKVDRGLEFSGIHASGLTCAIASGDDWHFDLQPDSLARGYANRFFYADAQGSLGRPANRESSIAGTEKNHWRSIRIPDSRCHIEYEKSLGAPVERPRSVSDLVVCAIVEADDRNRAWMRANEIDPTRLFTIQNSRDEESSRAGIGEWQTKEVDS